MSTVATASHSRNAALAVAPSRGADHAWDVMVVVVANAAVVLGLWVRHGGVHTLDKPGGALIAAGQLTGLIGTYAVLVQLLLMSRIGWLERHVGFDRLAVWHRWNGFAAVSLLASHAVFITLGYATEGRQSIPAQLGDFIRHYPDVLMSIVGLALFVAIAVTSVRAARRRLTREAWYALHLYAYLAVALAFAHQLSVGTDFSTDRLARVWWIALYLAVFGAILAWRVGRPMRFNARHRLRVLEVRPESVGVVSVYIGGRDLDRIGARAGQFFLWRFLTGTGWARAHPFSLSAAPNSRFLRITIKELGDDTGRMQRLRPGTRVFAEGPYGTFTAERRTRRDVALIAGGIGITPLRALVESLDADAGDVTLLYRVVSDHDLAFRDELARLARRGLQVHELVGPEIGDDRTDRLGVPALRALIPDIARRDVYVCGPPAMLDALRRRLRVLGVSRRHVHFERFDY
ncbi:MAG: oxidoreductase [Acidimicrobiales bacterium]|jgi:predicted ferric reductase|nr:oxidoreductase [Acidimicrobiales bacterium]